jgi:hypothetical protein
MFTAHLWLPRIVSAGLIAIFLFTVHQHQRRGSARSVPDGKSLAELVAFHRRELARRRDFLQTLWYWKIVPIGIPALATLIVRRNQVTLTSALVTVGSLVLAHVAARRQAQGLQQRIDELDTQAGSLDRASSS